MKGITIGYGLDPVPYGPIAAPEAGIPVGVGVGVGVSGASIGFSKEIAEVEININPTI